MTNISGASGVTSAQTGAVAADAQGAAAAGAGSSGGLTGSTQLKSINDLQKRDPKLYNLMMQGIASNIVSEMKAHDDKMKELNRKAREG